MKAFFDKLDALTIAPFRLDEWAVLIALAVVVVGGFVWVVAMILEGTRERKEEKRW